MFRYLLVFLISVSPLTGMAQYSLRECAKLFKGIIRPSDPVSSIYEDDFNKLISNPDRGQKGVIAIFTDTTINYTSGVTNAQMHTKKELEKKGYRVDIIHPHFFKTAKLPFYSQIEFAIRPGQSKKIGQYLDEVNPDYIHILTEGPVGIAATFESRKRKMRYSSSFLTLFPEVIQKLLGVRRDMVWKILKTFVHDHSASVLTLSKAAQQKLNDNGIKNTKIWGRGIDFEKLKYNPNARNEIRNKRGPVFDKLSDHALRLLNPPVYVYLGRISKEKGLENFLNAKVDGAKLVIGDGPLLETLKKEYPRAIFTGEVSHKEISDFLSASDVFVFPSKHDVLGTVIIEAQAFGLPVVAYNLNGPKDFIEHEVNGLLGPNLEKNMKLAYKYIQDGVFNRDEIMQASRAYTWERATEMFINGLVSTRP
ncbi:MAG: glycosyltransferase [Halobacteriovoraceae bacterium]|nr:glycosyltransferase [Halobacteriovoraceae bacterium]